ncbi:MAG: hypothetical protein R2734_19335 [Nocardioides sp.]
MTGPQPGPDAPSVAPTLDDPLVGAVSEAVGGPLGSRAGRHPWWTPARVVLLLTALTFALGMLQKAPCYQTSWQDGDLRYRTCATPICPTSTPVAAWPS